MIVEFDEDVARLSHQNLSSLICWLGVRESWSVSTTVTVIKVWATARRLKPIRTGLSEVTVIDEIKYDNQKLGSTLIRRYLNEGKLKTLPPFWDGFTKSKASHRRKPNRSQNSTSRPQTSPSGRILRRYGREFMLPSSSLTAINISGYAISVTIRPLIPKKNDA